MFEVIWIAGCALLGIVCAVSVARTFLNSLRSRFRRLGLPLTLGNLFFLSSEEERIASERVRRQAVEDDLVLAKELAREELRKEVEERVTRGVSRAQASDAVLHGETDNKEPPKRPRPTMKVGTK